MDSLEPAVLFMGTISIDLRINSPPHRSEGKTLFHATDLKHFYRIYIRKLQYPQLGFILLICLEKLTENLLVIFEAAAVEQISSNIYHNHLRVYLFHPFTPENWRNKGGFGMENRLVKRFFVIVVQIREARRRRRRISAA